MNKQNFTWVHKYAPKTIDEVVMVDRLKKRFQCMVEEDEISDLLLYGSAGIAKTTLANVLTKDYDTLFLNMSIDNSIDVIRHDVRNFVNRGSIDGKKKAIIGDECLEENEEIMIGTKEENKYIKMKDLPKNKYFDIVSYDFENNELVNDEGIVHIERETDIYEVELDNGDKIKVSSNHPFFIEHEGEIKEKSIDDGLKIDDRIIVI